MTPIEQVLRCQECGCPWGAILRRGVEPSDEMRQLAQSQMAGQLVNLWRCWEGEDDLGVDESRLPRVAPTEVVYITEALARFASEYLNADAVLGACWQEVDSVDVPRWTLKGRKRRTAYRWNCCTLGSYRLYVPAEVTA